MISPAEWYEVSWYDIVVVRSLRNSLEVCNEIFS